MGKLYSALPTTILPPATMSDAVTPAQQAGFQEWLAGRGGWVHPEVSLCDTLRCGDRGVRATADIKAGSQLLVVPVSCTLHLDVADAGGAPLAATCSPELAAFLQAKPAGAGSDGSKQQQQPFSSFLATTLMLMAELAKGEASAFAPYFATLPLATDCLINWNKQEQQLLAGTSLSGVTRSLQDIFESDIAPRLAAAGPELSPPGSASFEAFRRAADLVQTRAFHMSAENWLTGASQEATEELYLIPAIDMLNHSTDPAARNTSLALVRGTAEVALGKGGATKTLSNFFSMRAEVDIPAGSQILHTYGSLGDAQLLQTYGFIDICPAAAAASTPAAAEADGGEPGQLRCNPHNYVALPLQQLLTAVKAEAAATQLWPAKRADKVLAGRLAHLAGAGLLRVQAPESSELLLTAADPLPDTLLTILQVLMMTEEEFSQLQQAEAGEETTAADGSGGGAGSSKASSAGAQHEQQQCQAGLNLGREMLEGEFGEMCGTVLLQAVDLWLQRYPADAKAAAAMLAPGGSSSAAPGSRPWLAAALVLGEQQLLLQLRKAAILIMMEAAAQTSDSGELEEGDSGDEESQEMEEEEMGAGGQPGKKRKQPAAAAAAAAADGGDSKHHHHKHHHHHHKKHARGGGSGKQQRKDDRPHYGDMTGPRERDVWESDDSDKVGFSSGSEGEEEGEPRHTLDPSEHHTYEVGAGGAVRESHGRMLGPDEAALLESDDSDKVGYGDEGAAAAADAAEGDAAASAAAAAGGRDSGGKRPRRGAGARGAEGAAGSGGGCKRPKRGLGFKGGAE